MPVKFGHQKLLVKNMNTTIISPIKQLPSDYLPKSAQQLTLFANQTPAKPDANQNLPANSQQSTDSKTPKIYTSYYKGKQIGKSISISLLKPNWCDFEHRPEFAPSRQLLNYWNESNKGANAIAYYTKIYLAAMSAKDKEIDEWLTTVIQPITLNCYEVDSPDYIDNPFCHRHLFGQIIKRKRPDLWGGEVAYALIKNEDPTPLDIGFKEGQQIKYFWAKDKQWIDATFKQVHTTSFSKPGQFSFIEVVVNDRVLKAYSLSQIQAR